jgi:hypothetical protein
MQRVGGLELQRQRARACRACSGLPCSRARDLGSVWASASEIAAQRRSRVQECNDRVKLACGRTGSHYGNYRRHSARGAKAAGAVRML